MATTPWMTSDQLVESVKRKIAFPIAQATFSSNDILAFANDEMFISQVPSVLEYHEEFFVTYKIIPLQTGLNRYPIPDRAIGMRLRDIKWQDNQGNMFDMTRVAPEDKAFFQRNIGSNNAVHKFYVEGNDVVLLPAVTADPTGQFVLSFFLRPNQLVVNDRAAIISHFSKDITVDNTTIVAGDTINVQIVQTISITPAVGNPSYQSYLPGSTTTTITNIATLTAVTGAPAANEFQIGATSTITATNLAAALNTLTGIIFNATNGSPTPTNTIHVQYDNVTFSFATSNTDGFVIPSTTQGIDFVSIPSSIFSNGSVIDFLQTKPGHRIFSYDITIPANGISGNTILFTATDVPVPNNFNGIGLSVGDYICLANEAIIPQLPPDLHTGLAERTSARILASMGDAAGLQAANQKIQEIDSRQGTILDNRVEGTPQKITARHSLLRYGKMGVRRRV